MKVNQYVSCEYNEIMELLGDKPTHYTLHAQFRDTSSGAVRLFMRDVRIKKDMTDKELEKFLQSNLEKFIAEKEASTRFSFIPYESAIYEFPNTKRKKIQTWKAKCFYSKTEEESHKFFLDLARGDYYGNIL